MVESGVRSEIAGQNRFERMEVMGLKTRRFIFVKKNRQKKEKIILLRRWSIR